jgi:hypothetical protein
MKETTSFRKESSEKRTVIRAITKVFFPRVKKYTVSETFSSSEYGNGQYPKYEPPEKGNRNTVP